MASCKNMLFTLIELFAVPAVARPDEKIRNPARRDKSETCHAGAWSAIRNSFTLIELLVVIAIISILMAMLLPALKAARDTAKSILCVSNQKQVSLSTLNYTVDSNDYLPYNWMAGSAQYTGGTFPYYSWDQVLLWGGYINNFKNNAYTGGSLSADFGIPNVRTSTILICPRAPFSEDLSRHYAPSTWTAYNSVPNIGSTTLPHDWSNPYCQIKLGKIKSPDSGVMLSEVWGGEGGWPWCANNSQSSFSYTQNHPDEDATAWDGYMTYRHGKLTVNIICFDGHSQPEKYFSRTGDWGFSDGIVVGPLY